MSDALLSNIATIGIDIVFAAGSGTRQLLSWGFSYAKDPATLVEKNS
jgi:hypothetical protein